MKEDNNIIIYLDDNDVTRGLAVLLVKICS